MNRLTIALLAGAVTLVLQVGVANAVTCAPPTGDAYAKAVLANAPIAYYRLDDASGSPMCDASTQVNDGSYAGSGVTYGVRGALLSTKDASVTGNGTPGDIGVSNSNAALSGNSSFTYEAWFRSAGTAQNQALVDVGNSGNGNIAGLTTWNNVGSCTPDGSSIGLDEYAGSNCWDTVSVGVNLYDGSWHYLAVTYDAATATVDAYVDALGLGAQHVATGSGAFSLSSSPVRVGNWIDTVVNQPFNGGLDEVAVYPSALSAKTILAHYKAAGYLPAIRKLSPDAGSTAGGNTVTITGTGFTQDAKVTFGSTPAASLTFVSSTELKATAPPEAAGVVKVTVTNYVGSSKTTKADLYAYGPPAVTSINPTSGTTAGGTVVTIIGSGFVPAAKVHFGTDAATVKFVSPTTLTATSPAQPAGSVDVTVTTAAGTSTTSPADVFTYN